MGKMETTHDNTFVHGSQDEVKTSMPTPDQDLLHKLALVESCQSDQTSAVQCLEKESYPRNWKSILYPLWRIIRLFQTPQVILSEIAVILSVYLVFAY